MCHIVEELSGSWFTTSDDFYLGFSLCGAYYDITGFDITLHGVTTTDNLAWLIDGTIRTAIQTTTMDQPWVQIDMGEHRYLDGVTILNTRFSSTHSWQLYLTDVTYADPSNISPRDSIGNNFMKTSPVVTTWKISGPRHRRYVYIVDTQSAANLDIAEIVPHFTNLDLLPPFKDCAEIYRFGILHQGDFDIQPFGTMDEITKRRVKCEDGWTTILNRDNVSLTSVSSTTNFENYNVMGPEDFWLGLTRIKALFQSEPYEVRFQMKDVDGIFAQARYSSIDISSTETLELGGYVPVGGVSEAIDSMYKSNGTKLTNSCAEHQGSIGWFGGAQLGPGSEFCTGANLFGEMGVTEASRKVVYWQGFRGLFQPLTKLSMQIRPKDFETKRNVPLTSQAIAQNHFDTAKRAEFGTNFTYECQKGRQKSSNLTLSCEWDGNWKSDGDLAAFSCPVSHCLQPPPSPKRQFRVLDWDGEPIPFGQVVKYRCPGAMKFKSNFSKPFFTLTCQPNGEFDPFPSDEECVTTSICPPLPAQPNVPANSLWVGDVRLNRPGFSGYGECLSQGHTTYSEPAPSSSFILRTYLHKRYSETTSITRVHMFLTGPIEEGLYTLNITTKQNLQTTGEYKIGLMPNQLFWEKRFDQVPAGQKMYLVTNILFERTADELLCILDVSYTKDTMANLLDPHSRSQRSKTFDPAQSTQLFDAQVEYECGFARGFDLGAGLTSPNLTLTCLGTGSWDKPVSDCIWLSCLDPPDKSDLGLEIVEYQGLPINANTTYDFDTTVDYKCQSGKKFKADFDLVSVQATCKAGNVWIEPADWGVCVDTALCSNPPEAPVNGSALIRYSGSKYGPTCPNLFTQPSTCSNVEVQSISQINEGESKFDLNILSQGAQVAKTFLGMTFTAKDIIIQPSESIQIHPTNSSSVFMLELNLALEPDKNQAIVLKVKHSPLHGKVCVEDLVCYQCSSPDQCFSLRETEVQSFLNSMPKFEAQGEFLFETEIEYSCPTGRGFKKPDQDLTSLSTLTSCQWNGTWTVAHLDPCVWTHCLEPPSPPDSTFLTLSNWNELPVNLEEEVQFQCQRGMKFVKDIDQSYNIATCRPNNQWDIPEWGQCVETQVCPMPSKPPPQGSIVVHNSGMMFGHVCLGSNNSWDAVPGSGCHSLRIRANLGLMDSGSAQFALEFTNTQEPASTLLSLLQFSSPIDPSAVSVSGPATIEPTTSATTFLLTTEMVSPTVNGGQSKVDLTFTLGLRDPVPCLLESYCTSCLNQDCPSTADLIKTEMYQHQNLTMYGTKLEYTCALGQEFESSPTKFRECLWNKTWSGDDDLNCIRLGCVDPPHAPEGHHVISLHQNGTSVPFGESTYYVCEPGYFFEEDKSLRNFSLICLQDGTWTVPTTWKRCFLPTERVCPNPHLPSENHIYDWNPDATPKITEGFTVKYSCKTGRRLQGLQPNGSKYLYDEQPLTCEWNQTWSPSRNIDPCVWHECINPPVPVGHQLISDRPIGTYRFGEKAVYRCAKSGLWMEGDRTRTFFEAECLPNGSFNVPVPFPACVTTVDCGNPPEKTKGGTRIWNGETVFGTEVRYTCGKHAKFVNRQTNELYQEAKISCQWNKTWSPTRLDPCIWSHCNYVPSPPASSGLIYEPQNGTEWIVESEYTSYTPHIPAKVNVPYNFGYGKVFYIEGQIVDFALFQTFPIVQIRDNLGNVVFRAVIDPDYGLIRIASSLNDNTEEFRHVNVDYGLEFDMEIVYNAGEFAFGITFNGDALEPLKIPDFLPDLEFSTTEMVGDLRISFMGFIPPGSAPAIPVNATLVYRCPKYHVFQNGWYQKPIVRLTCHNNGMVLAPGKWPQCVYPELAPTIVDCQGSTCSSK
ncbi:uncharacterized protein LOC131880226 [Tigriopus californicus]|uniref:uncharacterized protein LOC131880226 n=1 Tax=Tigriopus californicus TaxID=6832 RepID=UPI0027DA570E|nr:uncharacterized protein LOC131880226 [Tigriopus californicus]